ncbi:MAG: YbaB/EbfC family nucleoid-associated protein [Parachlamydiales bacterium]
MGSGFAKKKKQARAFQDQLAQMQAQMAALEIEGSAGAGLVTVKMNGEHEVTSVSIKPECVDPEDVEGLEDLIKAALNDASSRLQTQASSGLPGLGSLGF